MKFGSHYRDYLNSEGQSKFPSVDFKKFKKLLKRCSDHNRINAQLRQQRQQHDEEAADFMNRDENLEMDGFHHGDNNNAVQNLSGTLPLEDEDSAAGAGSFPGTRISSSTARERYERDMPRMSTTRVRITEDEYDDALDDPRVSVDYRLSYSLARNESSTPASSTSGSSCCPGCDSEFFPDLDNTVLAVAECFNVRAKELLRLRRASGISKTLLRLTTRTASDRGSMLRTGNELVCYGCLNAIAIRKLLKKYDKIHNSGKGRAFKMQLQMRRVELLQSPLLIEMGALAVNLMDSQASRPFTRALPPGFYSACSFDGAKRTIAIAVQTGLRLEFDITCSICLEVVFDPISLGCGHIFCNSCVCAAASVPVFQGAKSAKRSSKCPLCRQVGVYQQAVSMGELSTLVRSRCTTYYKERRKEERAQRVLAEKLFWERQARAFTRG